MFKLYFFRRVDADNDQVIIIPAKSYMEASGLLENHIGVKKDFILVEEPVLEASSYVIIGRLPWINAVGPFTWVERI